MPSQECTYANHRLSNGHRALGNFRAVVVGVQEAIDAQ
jgi:hypothetical protein